MTFSDLTPNLTAEIEKGEPPLRIPARGGLEQDAFTGWRRVLCYMGRPGVLRSAKRTYNRRLRHIARRILKGAE